MILGWGAYAREPMCLRLPDLPIEQHYYYGAQDWMSKVKIVEMIEEN